MINADAFQIETSQNANDSGWQRWEAMCSAKGGQYASVHNQAEQEFLLSKKSRLNVGKCPQNHVKYSTVHRGFFSKTFFIFENETMMMKVTKDLRVT